MNTSFTTVVLSGELLGEKAVPMGQCENPGQPDEVPVLVGHADDEDEEDEEDKEDEDDFDEDDEDLGYDWEEVGDADEEDMDDDEDDDEDEDDEEPI